MDHVMVAGGDGVRLHVQESGRRDGPSILFVHGSFQSHLAWRYQFESGLSDEFRLVAFDLRGHGMSEVPDRIEAYTNPRLWANDVAAVIEQRSLQRPVIVGWSYGGFVTCDYIRTYGAANVAGVNFVGWGVLMGRTERELRFVGRGWHDYYAGVTSDDLATNIAATRGFVRACVAQPPSNDDLEVTLAYNMVVPPFVRRAMTARPPDDFTSTLATLTVPVLGSQGEADCVTLPIATRHLLDACPTARGSFYPGVGHSPFMEEPERFNRELAAFTRAACKTPVAG